MRPRKTRTSSADAPRPDSIAEPANALDALEPTPIDPDQRPYLTEASTFTAFLHRQRTASQRVIDDMRAEVERMEIEIGARLQRIGEHQEIVDRCSAGLGDPTPARNAPTFTPHIDLGNEG